MIHRNVKWSMGKNIPMELVIFKYFEAPRMYLLKKTSVSRLLTKCFLMQIFCKPVDLCHGKKISGTPQKTTLIYEALF